MKILLIAPLHREKEYFSMKRNSPFMKFQGQQSWVNALENLNHKVIVFRGNYMNSYYANFLFFVKKHFPNLFSKYMNIKNKYYNLDLATFMQSSKLTKIMKKNDFDLILLSGGITELKSNLLLDIKKKNNCKVLLMSGVNPDTAATYLEKEMIEKKIIDIVVENDEGYARKWKKMGVDKTIVLPISSTDSNLFKKVKLSKNDIKKYGSDVCFGGSLTHERQKILAGLVSYNLKIWGDVPLGEKLSDNLKNYYKGRAYDEKLIKIYNASKIIINFQPVEMLKGGNMRTFEIPGCGAFQLTDKIDGNLFTNGKDIVVYNNLDDLVDRIEFYLQNSIKRTKIAESGFRRTNKEHTYEKHFEKLLSEI